MAQYWEDWSGSTLSAEPTGWTKRWRTTNVAYAVNSTADPEAPAGRVLSITTSASQRNLISLDALDSDADRSTVEIAVLFKNQTLADTTGFGGLGRGAGSAGSESGKAGVRGFASPNQTIRVVRYNGGVAGSDTATNVTLTAGSYYWLVTTLSGNSTTVTIRTAADPATVIYTASSTSSSPAEAVGWAGIFTFASGYTWEVAAVGIGTGGSSAPFSDPNAGASVTGTLSATESGSDTASLAGDVLVSGSLAASESGADTAAMSGDVVVSGTLSASEAGSDTAALAGAVVVSGTIAATESGADTAQILGGGAAAPVTGSMAAVESGSDTASMSGTVVSAPFASLGSWGGRTDDAKPRRKKRQEEEERVDEALPEPVVSRLREEMVSAAIADDVTQRAKARAKQIRAEEEALLLMI